MEKSKMKKKSDKEDIDVYVYLFLVLSRIVLFVHMPLVPVFCFIVAHPSLVLYRVASLQSSGCANVMCLQIRNGDSDHAVGQWVIITVHI
jgi:hypothetical protein